MLRRIILSLNILSTKIGSVGRVERVAQNLPRQKPLLAYQNKES
jgi:hypothetical protein